MKRLLFTLLSIVLLAGGASAQISWKEIVITDVDEPTTVTFTTGGANYLEFTAVATGVVSFEMGWSGIRLYYSDVTGAQGDNVPAKRDASTGYATIYQLQVEEGQTYRLTTSSVTQAWTANVYYGEGESQVDLSMTSSYNDGDKYSVIDKNLELVFNLPISVENVMIAYGEQPDGTFAVERPVNSSYYSGTYTTQYFFAVELNKIIEPMIEENDIRPGEKFRITVNGIQSQGSDPQIYGEDGTYSVTLELDEMPVQVTDINPANGSTLYTFYPEGGDAGLITFTFDAELDPDPMANGGTRPISVTCSYGDPESGSGATHNLPYTIEGNTLTADIRGIRFPETISSSRGGEQPTSITLNLKGLRSVDGRDVRTNYVGAGTTAVIAIYPLEKEQIQFYYDSDPQDGGSLQGLDEIMLWLPSPYPLLSFDDLQWSWDTPRGPETRTIPSEDVQFEYDEQQFGYTAMVPLTGVPKTVANVTLTMRGAILRNGDTAELELVFNVPTGIDNVEAGEGNADEIVKVYTISGTLVKECKRGVATEGLAKGVYIIGGKKMVVR